MMVAVTFIQTDNIDYLGRDGCINPDLDLKDFSVVIKEALELSREVLDVPS